jgi:DNA polymerase
MTKQEKLNQLKTRLISDNPCSELKESANQLVFGTGNLDADVFFIGEAPGKKEDETGKPFVGTSGKFLDELLKSIKLQRADTYITNIVKYRPPNNRDPKTEEKEAFWPYLLEQINIIKPKVIATLGRHSGLAFNKSLHISADHGKPQEINLNGKVDSKVIFVPLYHPAAALYNGSLKKTLFEDFAIISKLIK